MLNITSDLVTELAEARGRADETGIVLTADGWQVATWSGLYQDLALVAMTKEDVDGQDAGDVAASEDYRIPDEHGNHSTPAKDARPQVVTGAVDRQHGTGWQDAWWFDQIAAVQLISEKHREYAEHGTASSLWRTAGGRYVKRIRTVHGGERETWTELNHAQVAEWAYAADDGMCEVKQPPVIVAARAARTIADALTPPAVRWSDGGEGRRFYRGDQPIDEAAEIIHAAATIADLLRETVAPQLRTHRSAAARVIEVAHDGNQAEAAAWLGMGRSTFAKLLPST